MIGAEWIVLWTARGLSGFFGFASLKVLTATLGGTA